MNSTLTMRKKTKLPINWKTYLVVNKASDSSYWYAGLVPFEILLEREDDFYWVREPSSGHLNIVNKNDVEKIVTTLAQEESKL